MRITKKIFLIAMLACSFTLVLFDAETGGKKGTSAPILTRTEAETGG